MKKKLIITTHTYYPYKDGVAIVNDYLTRGMADKGYKIIVITHEDPNLPHEEYHHGIRILRMFRQDNYDEYISFIKKNVSAEDTLVNICTQTPTTDVLLSELSSIKGRKVLYVHGIIKFAWTAENYASIHNFLSKIYNNTKWSLYYKRVGKYINNYDAIVQLHENDDGNLFFKKKFGKSGVIIENAAEDMCFSEKLSSNVLEKYGINGPYAICVSNYGTGKNQEMVLRAYAKCHDNASAINTLVFIGGDSLGYMSYLREIYEEMLLEDESLNVIFLKDIPRDDTIDLLKQSYMFVFGSRGEKFPVVIVEAMAAGVPFISTDVGIVKYFPGGIIVKNTEEMAQSICRLANDHELHDTLSKEGAEYARRRMRISDKVDAFEEICFGRKQ